MLRGTVALFEIQCDQSENRVNMASTNLRFSPTFIQPSCSQPLELCISRILLAFEGSLNDAYSRLGKTSTRRVTCEARIPG